MSAKKNCHAGSSLSCRIANFATVANDKQAWHHVMTSWPIGRSSYKLCSLMWHIKVDESRWDERFIHKATARMSAGVKVKQLTCTMTKCTLCIWNMHCRIIGGSRKLFGRAHATYRWHGKIQCSCCHVVKLLCMASKLDQIIWLRQWQSKTWLTRW